MPKLLVFQHVPFEILGTLDPLLRSYGFRVRYVNFGRQPDAPGPGSAATTGSSFWAAP